MKRAIYVTDQDMEQLRELLIEEKRVSRYIRDDLQELEAELDRSKVVSSGDVPEDIITMNSKVQLSDLETDEKFTYTLVFPDEADIEKNKISVLAPIGIGMLGYSVGDTFEWDVPGGIRKLKVEKVVYQPEAAGDE